MSHSSSLEYTMSIHAVHVGAERNVSYIVVSTETPQTTTNSSAPRVQASTFTPTPLRVLTSNTPPPPQPFVQMRYRCTYQVLSTGPNILEVYVIYLHVYMSVEILSHIACATTQISLCIFKVCQNFRCSHTQSMDVDKDKTIF